MAHITQELPNQSSDRPLITDRSKALAWVNLGYWDGLLSLSPELRNDREIVLTAVQRHGDSFLCAPKHLQADEEVALAAVTRSAKIFENLSETLRANKRVLTAAVNRSWTVLRFAPKDFLDDPDIVLLAVKQCGSALQFASERLKRDRTMVLAALQAVQNDEFALRHTSSEIRDDPEIALAAVTRSGHALSLLSKRLQEDRQFVVAAAITTWSILETLRKNPTRITSIPSDLTNPSVPFCYKGFPEKFLGIRPPRHTNDDKPLKFNSEMAYGDSREEIYALTWYPNAVAEFSKLLKEGERPSNLLLKIAQSRKQFASAAFPQEHLNPFGVLRGKETLFTKVMFQNYGRLYTESFLRLLFALPSDLSIHDQWTSLGSNCYDDLDTLVSEAIRKDPSLETLDQNIKGERLNSLQTKNLRHELHDRLLDMSYYNILFIKETIPGETQPSALTSVGVTVQTRGLVAQYGSMVTHRTPVSHPIPLIGHTSHLPEEKKRKVLLRIDQLVDELRACRSSTDVVLTHLAEIHWWLAQLSLFERGSASISEVLIQSIAASLGYEQSQWALDVLPDLEALPRPLGAFSTIYPMIFSLGPR